MSKKPKRPSVGERMLEPYVGLLGLAYDNDAKDLARRIDAAIRRAVREAWHSAKRSESVWNKKDIETKYGVTL